MKRRGRFKLEPMGRRYYLKERVVRGDDGFQLYKMSPSVIQHMSEGKGSTAEMFL